LFIASTEKAVLVNKDASFENPGHPALDLAALDPDKYRRCDVLAARDDPQLYWRHGAGSWLTSAVSLEHFGVESAIAHISPFLGFYESRYNESRVYSIIADRDIAPRILANLTEHGSRPVGWIIEHVAGRYATARDLNECRAVLAKLHELGISYGWLHIESFLIIQDGPNGKTRALMQDFRNALPNNDESELAEEMEKVESVLAEVGPSSAPA
jgi:hypothetical protein